ncbi:hypothetical protein C5689_05595 [Methylosinus sporium]|uniref:TonB-dependent siderophore receptor n=2 Tax=Methylosinus sporium TaxID=428 RepID=A0A2U1STI0_METSR|nr:hypothetical protein C5689_05595 [Methylosinus sporium]
MAGLEAARRGGGWSDPGPNLNARDSQMPSTPRFRFTRPTLRSNERLLLVGGCALLLPTQVHAQPVELPPIDVSALPAVQPMIGEGRPEGHKDYLITRSSTGSKAELPNSFVPQHVTTIPHKIIEEQAPRTITEALQNVSGVSSPYPSYYPLDQLTSLYIRGFQVSTTLRDGLWDPTPFGNAWIGNLERVEVLKGPSALLYGAYSGDVGGALNLVTKKPLSDPHATISSEFDTYGTHAVSADLSTPFADNKDWLVRLNMHEGGHRLFADDTFFEKRHISGMLQGQLTSQDAITLEAEYRWQNTHPYSGQPGFVTVGSGASAILAPLAPTSRDTNLYDPRSTYRYRSDALRAVYEHKFDDNWSFKSSAQYTLTSRDTVSITATPSLLSSGAEKFTQSYSEIRMGPVYAVDTDQMLHGRFSTFGFSHDLVLGGRFTDQWYKMDMRKPTNSFSSFYFNDPNYPNWGAPALNVYQYMFGDSDTHQFNEYLNDVVSITDQLRLSAGVNLVQYRSFSESGMNPLKMSSSKSRGSGVGWRVGLLYDFLPGFTAYSGYSTTFNRNIRTRRMTGRFRLSIR